MVKAIIIDEKATCIELLCSILKEHCAEEVVIAATSTLASEGKMLIDKHDPDIVFIDVDMPRLAGSKHFKKIQNPRSRVICLTAGNNYAVEAFRLNAMNYLRKPFVVSDVVNMVHKLKREIENGHLHPSDQLQELERLWVRHADGSDNKMAISMADKIVFINISDLIYCEASGSYCCLYLITGENLMTSKLLVDFEKQLDGHNFFRIHHHCLINLNRVKEYQRNHGGYVIMENGKELEVSKRKRKDFLWAIHKIIV